MPVFPKPDAEFNDYIQRVTPYLITNKVRLLVSTGNITSLNLAKTDWDAVYPPSQNPDLRTTVITDKKNNSRKNYELLLRTIYGDIPQSVLTLDDRATFNLNLRDTTPTASREKEYAPVIALDKATHLIHSLRITDPQNPASRAMPAGQHVMLERFVGAAGIEPATLIFSNAQDVSTALTTINYTETEVGKTAYYHACYVSSRSVKGPWSSVFTVVVM